MIETRRTPTAKEARSPAPPNPKWFNALSELCPKCLTHFMDNPYLVEACASVGIEHGKSTGLMMREYFQVFHKNKHKES